MWTNYTRKNHCEITKYFTGKEVGGCKDEDESLCSLIPKDNCNKVDIRRKCTKSCGACSANGKK